MAVFAYKIILSKNLTSIIKKWKILPYFFLLPLIMSETNNKFFEPQVLVTASNNIAYVERPELERVLEIIHGGDRSAIISLSCPTKYGRSSLIEEVSESAEKNPKCLTTRSECCWFEREGSVPIEEFFGDITSGLLTQLQFATLSRREEVLEEKDQSLVEKNDEENKMSPKNFLSFMKLLREKLGGDGEIIITLDDATVFKQIYLDGDSDDKGLFPNFNKIYQTFQKLVADKSSNLSKIFIVFAGIKDYYQKDEYPGAIPIDMKPFDQDEIKALIEMGGLDLNPDAFKFLWEITGGHPSITQLILREITKEKDHHKRLDDKSVAVEIVRGTVEAIFNNNFLFGYLNYLKTINVPIKMESTLTSITERANPEEGYIFSHSGLDQAHLDYFENYGLIEKNNNGQYYLRIGFFKNLFTEPKPSSKAGSNAITS